MRDLCGGRTRAEHASHVSGEDDVDRRERGVARHVREDDAGIRMIVGDEHARHAGKSTAAATPP